MSRPSKSSISMFGKSFMETLFSIRSVILGTTFTSTLHFWSSFTISDLSLIEVWGKDISTMSIPCF